MPGTVTLYSMEGIKRADYFYSDYADRKRIVDIWMHENKLEGHYIQIAPDVNLTGRSAVHLKKAKK